MRLSSIIEEINPPSVVGKPISSPEEDKAKADETMEKKIKGETTERKKEDELEMAGLEYTDMLGKFKNSSDISKDDFNKIVTNFNIQVQGMKDGEEKRKLINNAEVLKDYFPEKKDIIDKMLRGEGIIDTSGLEAKEKDQQIVAAINKNKMYGKRMI